MFIDSLNDIGALHGISALQDVETESFDFWAKEIERKKVREMNIKSVTCGGIRRTKRGDEEARAM
jgi:hypothetical protein